MLIAQRVEKMTAAYDDSRRTVGQFLIDVGAGLGQYSMQQVADVTFTSKATLVRIAKQLGFTGWRDFAAAYVAEAEQRAKDGAGIDVNLPFGANAPVSEVAEAVCRVREESTRHTCAALDATELARAVDLLFRAKRLALFGTSVNQTALEQFQRKLLVVGRTSLMVPQAEYGFLVETLGPGDCALVVSYSGDNPSRPPMSQAVRLRERGASVVALTSLGDNCLRRTADVTFTIFSQEHLYSKIATFSTEASIEFLLDTLYGCLFARDYDALLAHKVEASRAAEVNRRAEHDRLWW